MSKVNDTAEKDLPVLRVAGVPEHFNEPWIMAIEENLFRDEGLDVQWHSIKEGTGAMIDKLKSNDVDVIVALTEGLINEIANGSNVRLLGTYVQSPLIWSVSTGMTSTINSIEDLKGKTFGISRYQSGSHLMSCVLASQYGWKQSDLQFLINHNFDQLKSSVQQLTSDAFLWEYFMQKPFYDQEQIRPIGRIITPWPCFLIASTNEIITSRLNDLTKMFQVLEESCLNFKNNSKNSIERISEKFHLTLTDAKDWFDSVNIIGSHSIAESTIETTIDALKTAKIFKGNDQSIEAIRFLDTRLAKLTVDIKSMRLYNKPELLILLRNNLRVHNLGKGNISYKDLLPFDQNHYHGTDVLDLAVHEVHLDENIHSSKWIIQIGSNLGGCARYLAGKYHLKVLAIELQNDLSEVANELTNRCGLTHSIHHIAGDFLNVAQHLQSNLYEMISSWITILHFQENDRIPLFKQSFRLLKENGYFYTEDFLRIGNLTNEENQILEHDVFCQYLPSREEYQSHLLQAGFQIIQLTDLSNDWKIVTKQRLEAFQNNRSQFIEIHGEDIYQRLQSFYQSIVTLFHGNNVGGIRIVAKKRTS